MDMLQNILGYQFNDLKLLERALRHRSVGSPNNERLEFLGDSVLGFIIAEELFKEHREIREGGLSRMRSYLVNADMLAKLAKELGLSEFIELGAGEEKTGGRKRTSIISDALEAIIGAIYLDGGLDKARECILRWYADTVSDLSKLKPSKDPKSKLQEILQAKKLPLPVYHAAVKGEAHSQVFTATCIVEGLPHKTKGESSSRRKAEQIAAEKYLEILDGKVE